MIIKFNTNLDIENHARSIPGWEQEYIQLEPGNYVGKSVSLTGKEHALFRETGSLSVCQVFEYDNDYRHFLIPIKGTGTYPFAPEAFYQLPRTTKMRSMAPAGYEVIVLSMRLHHMPWMLSRDTECRILPLSMADYRLLYTELDHLTRFMMTSNKFFRLRFASLFERKLEDISAYLIDTLSSPGERYKKYYSNSRYIVDACQQSIEMNPTRPPTLMELCRMLRISRRTLQYSFEKETRLKPSIYLMNLRLNAVHKSLKIHTDLSVGECAASQGFFNLPYFSRCYRHLFNETATQTRNKAIKENTS